MEHQHVTRRIVRMLRRVVALLLTLLLLLVNLRLFHSKNTPLGVGGSGSDDLAQLRFIGGALREGAGERMQRLFPEGFFFSHVLYGLAWVNVGLDQPLDSALHREALAEVRWVLERLDSPVAQAPFGAMTEPRLGVFYVGWSSWLRGGLLRLQPDSARDPEIVVRFVADCTALAEAFGRSSTPFLAAYPQQSWPVDSVVAVAALRLHDTLLFPRFGATIEQWLRSSAGRLDPATGLLPHRVDWVTGQPLEGARGSSQSIIERFLPEIDPQRANEQYARFRRQFVTTVSGIPGVREYPVGQSGAGDVDSGPLIFGVSLSATVVTVGAALINADRSVAEPLVDMIEAGGMPLRWDGKKRYGFGQLPVGDAFLVWSKTARPWITGPAAVPLPPLVSPWWRFWPHCLSLPLLALLWMPDWRRRLRKRR